MKLILVFNFFVVVLIIHYVESFQISSNENDLSFGAKIHIFIMKLIGKHHVVVKKEEPKIVHEKFPRHYRPWHKTTQKSIVDLSTTSTEAPFVLGFETWKQQPDGSIKRIPEPIDETFEKHLKRLLKKKLISNLPDGFVKIFITTTQRPTTVKSMTEFMGNLSDDSEQLNDNDENNSDEYYDESDEAFKLNSL